MLHAPRVAGPDQLRLFVEALGGVDRSSRLIDVHPSSLRRWMRGSVQVPLATLHALYWLTPWGFSDAYAQAHWTHQHVCYQLRELRLNGPAKVEPQVVGIAANDATIPRPGPVALRLVG